ncbi:sensor histidine kinase [Actinokineospora globicatena]|uniref:sensor histidine kinase n=1 Tax=Actinokineospora globicatena TaxID=103729 RepID=UPI0020A53015|nr:ATP-binding protein [Actinokineospora globicatena]MCP2304159.1 Histidine kinase-, DNA gyrase B-, and HSP90-like ATPase [Actinokineospora globicatena]GLW78484.1 hypothetical protein Aglo01_29660 [Actinokineospora globicatena]GLW84852.1 hypothetical protein Aglo02_24920 [Actinokineospora globicatena]
MRGFDEAQVRFSTAVRAAAPLWAAGCWIRAGLLAGVWLTLLWADPADRVRGAAHLLVGTGAVLLAFAHVRPETLAALGRVPGLRRLVGHLTSTSGRATVDASGLAEGAGALLATWLFAGPFPLASLPPGVRVVGLVLAILYVWEAVLQAVIDPGWYSVEQPPPRGMRVFRYTFAPVLSSIILVGAAPYTEHAVSTAAWLVLSATPFLYYPVWAAFDVLLRASVSHARTSHLLNRQEIAIDLHSQVKNSAGLLQRYVDEPAPVLAEVRSLAREVLMRVEELRRDVLDVHRDQRRRHFGDLWETTQRVLPSHWRPACVLRDGAEVVLGPADAQIARRVLPDLLTNALNAGAESVELTCWADADEVVLTVRDDGPGISPDDLDRPHGSAALLRGRLVLFGGDIEWTATGVGTLVRARWRTQSHEAGTRLSPPGTDRRGGR